MDASALLSSLVAQRVVIGVGEMAVSNQSSAILSTYALGSCIGVVAYDPVVSAGGILHLMLPDSKISPQKAANHPAMFADTGLPLFFEQLHGLRTQRARLRLFMAGGASVILGKDPFKIGERNLRATVDYLRSNGYQVAHSQVGGSVNRTVHLDLSDGTVTLKTSGSPEEKIPLGG